MDARQSEATSTKNEPTTPITSKNYNHNDEQEKENNSQELLVIEQPPVQPEQASVNRSTPSPRRATIRGQNRAKPQPVLESKQEEVAKDKEEAKSSLSRPKLSPPVMTTDDESKITSGKKWAASKSKENKKTS